MVGWIICFLFFFIFLVSSFWKLSYHKRSLRSIFYMLWFIVFEDYILSNNVLKNYVHVWIISKKNVYKYLEGKPNAP